MFDLPGCNRKTLVVAALTAILAAAPAAAAPVKGSALEPGWLWQALSWLASPWGWVAAAQESAAGTPPPGAGSVPATATPPEGVDAGWSVDPNGQPR